MANGYGSLIAGQTLKESGVLLTQRSFTLPFLISLIKQRKSGNKTQPVENTKNKWETNETGTFGSDDWSISTSYKAMDKND